MRVNSREAPIKLYISPIGLNIFISENIAYLLLMRKINSQLGLWVDGCAIRCAVRSTATTTKDNIDELTLATLSKQHTRTIDFMELFSMTKNAQRLFLITKLSEHLQQNKPINLC